MAEKEVNRRQDASSEAEEDELPCYFNGQGQEFNQSTASPPPEKSGQHVPTAAAPFNFPTSSDLPSYSSFSAVDIPKPFAIPQTLPAPDSPFLRAYPPTLLKYGITAESWCSFVDTLSAFLSAKVSKQALHHASDIASQLGDYHKQYADSVKQNFKSIGKSAKRFNPLGIIGGTVALTLGGVGHAVGSVVSVPVAMMSKPKTPRERATVYLATANKDWFTSRGLQAILLNTEELSALLGTQPERFLGLANAHAQDTPAEQLAALKTHIGDLEVRQDEPREQSSGSNASSSGARAMESSNAAGKRPWTSQLQLGAATLWLVITQESKMQEAAVDEKER